MDFHQPWYKFHQFWTGYLPATPWYFHFGMITRVNIKLDICIDIVEIQFGIANGQKFVNFLSELFAHHMSVSYFLGDSLSKCQ